MKVGDKVYWFNSNLDVIEESIITGFNAFGGDAWITFRTTKMPYPKNLLFESRDALRKYYINRFIDDDIAENEKRLQEVKEKLWGQKKEIEEQRSFRRYLPDPFPCPFMRKNKSNMKDNFERGEDIALIGCFILIFGIIAIFCFSVFAPNSPLAPWLIFPLIFIGIVVECIGAAIMSLEI